VSKTTYADWTKVTLYRNGVLIWGTEPPAATPAPTMTPPANPLTVQYKTGDTITNDSSIKPGLRIVNQTSSTVPMSELKIRYYFTRDSVQSLLFSCDYAIFGCANMTGSFTPINAVGADYYLEVGFTPGAGSIAPNSTTVGIATRINKADWSVFNETNDYSFDVSKTAYADWTKVTLYRNGVLIWGTEPTPSGSAPASAPTFQP